MEYYSGIHVHRASFIILLISIFLTAQGLSITSEATEPTQNRSVLMELFTETWCGPCHNADVAADNVYEEYPDDRFIILEYHYDQQGDPFHTPETNHRFNQYYDFNSWPSAMFDGIHEDVGSGEIEDIEDRYRSHVENDINTKSHFYMKILEPSYEDGNGYVRAYIDEKSDSDRSNITVFTAIYRDKLHFDGGNGITDHRYVVRELFSDALDLPTDVVEYNFSLPNDSTYMKNGDNVGVVIFLQDDDTKEVLQVVNHKFFSDNSTHSTESNGGENQEGSFLLEPRLVIPLILVIAVVILVFILATRGPPVDFTGRSSMRSRNYRDHSSFMAVRGRQQGKFGRTQRISHAPKSRGGLSIDPQRYVNCPTCKTKLKKGNLDSHMRRVHGK